MGHCFSLFTCRVLPQSRWCPVSMRLSTTGALLLLASCGHGLAAPSRRWAYPDNLLGGCGKSLPSGQTNGGTYNVSISSSGIDRTYLVFVPPHYNPWLPTPLILSYHGGNRNATQQLQLDLLTEPQFNTVSMVVYPQGQSVSAFTLIKNQPDGRTPGKVFPVTRPRISNSQRTSSIDSNHSTASIPRGLARLASRTELDS